MIKEELTLSAFSQGIQDALAHLNITRLTDTQKEVIPAMMNGRDVIVKAATASGKTFSCLIPVLERMEPGKRKAFSCLSDPCTDKRACPADRFCRKKPAIQNRRHPDSCFMRWRRYEQAGKDVFQRSRSCDRHTGKTA
jgi:ATP-dependent helicase YprA (DUF1998 family)